MNNNQIYDQGNKIKKRSVVLPVVLLAVGALASLAVVLILLLWGSGGYSSEVKEQLALAERYLDELDYEKAVAAYKAAIELDPKCEEAYAGLAEAAGKLADSYIDKGEEEKAEELLEETLDILVDGYRKTGEETIKEKRTQIREMSAKLVAKKDEKPEADDDGSKESSEDDEAAGADREDTAPEAEGPLAEVEFEWDISTVTIFDEQYGDEFPYADECDLHVISEVPVSFTQKAVNGGYEYRDAAGKLILEEKTEQTGNKKKYSCKLYSFEYDLDIIAEPVSLVPGLPGYPLGAVIRYDDGRTVELTDEDMQRRGQTGFWYFGICSVSGGQLDVY
ncbi:MAG: DUF2225 domain-containing protein [Lachnospiraceae bacterium]|nr:DUF2225 domain-containing protein [Lachnospiraceae bacterium]